MLKRVFEIQIWKIYVNKLPFVFPLMDIFKEISYNIACL